MTKKLKEEDLFDVKLEKSYGLNFSTNLKFIYLKIAIIVIKATIKITTTMNNLQKQSLEYADAQASREIQAFLDEKSSQEGKPQPKNKPDEVDSKNLESKEIDVKKGHAIEKELEKIVSSGKKEILLEELKQLAPESYEVIFSNYKKGEQNGIETTRYNVLEKENEFSASLFNCDLPSLVMSK